MAEQEIQYPEQLPLALRDIYLKTVSKQFQVVDLPQKILRELEEVNKNSIFNQTAYISSSRFAQVKTSLKSLKIDDKILAIINGNKHKRFLVWLIESDEVERNEIAISSHIRKNLSVKLGDKVTLDRGNRTLKTGVEINDAKTLSVYEGRHREARELRREGKRLTESQIESFVTSLGQDEQIYLMTGVVYKSHSVEGPRYVLFDANKRAVRDDQSEEIIAADKVGIEIYAVNVTSDTDLKDDDDGDELDEDATEFKIKDEYFSMMDDWFNPGYSDIGGYNEELAKVRQLEIFLNYSEVAQAVGGTSGIKNISNVLITGISGVGKTKAILALANETNSELISITNPDELPAYFAQAIGIGHGVWRDSAHFNEDMGKMIEMEINPKNVFTEILAHPLTPEKWTYSRKGFPQIGKKKLYDRDEPLGVILFFDDIDVMFSKDAKAANLGIKDFLAKIRPIPNIITVMNSNEPHKLHPLLMGQFDTDIKFGLPSKEDRYAILRLLTSDYKLAEDVNLHIIADECHGFTPHDLEILCSNAISNAINYQKEIGLLSPNEKDREIIWQVIRATEVRSRDFTEARKSVSPSGLKDGVVEKPDVKWDDIGVMPAIRERIVSEVSFVFQDPEIIKALGKDQTKGILLYGPPGCGKTTIAKAISSDRNINFISIDVSKIFSGVMGEAEANLESQLQLAESYSPCIIFIDEIDTIGGKRKTEGAQMDSGSESRERVLNKLLTKMDGMSSASRVLYVGATNRPQLLDTALLRPGRFNPLIHIMLPTEDARKDILEKLLRDQNVSAKAIEKIAKKTKGFSGADLKALVNDAQRFGRDRYVQFRAIKERYQRIKSGEPKLSIATFGDLDGLSVEMQKKYGFNQRVLEEVLQQYSEEEGLADYMEDDSMEAEKDFIQFHKQISFSDLVKSLQQKKPSVSVDEIRVYEDFESNHPSGITDPEYLEAIENARSEFGIEKPKTRWEDIGGLDGVRKEILKTVAYATKYKGLTRQMGYSTGRGFLFYGPPGNGKTLIAKAMAAELKMNFMELKITDIVSKWVGESEKNLQAKINSARLRKPCIILMDEIDSLFTKRGDGDGGYGSNVSDKLVNIILTAMDGMSDEEGLYFVGTTNRPWSIDDALLRGGRLDKSIYIPLPDEKGRIKVLKALLRKMPTSITEEEYEKLAKETGRFTGADLSTVVNKAKERLMFQEIKKAQQADDTSKFAQRQQQEQQDEDYPLSSKITYDLLSKIAKDIKPNFDKESIAKYLEFHNKTSTSIEDEEYQKMIQDGGAEFSVAHSKVTWDDIGGLDFIKEQFEKAIIYPREHPELYERLGMKTPKGALLYGPPGCGKTMIGKALANQMNLPFTSVTAADIKTIFDVKKLFERARSQPQGCILFIDEMDTLVSKREGLEGHAMASVGQQTLVTTFLTNLDGVEEAGNFILIGATNHPENIDSAVMRPGRLDVKIYVPLPPKISRVNILKAKTKESIFDELDQSDYDWIAEQTEGFSGADIELLVQQIKSQFADEAIKRGLRPDQLVIERKDFSDLLGKKMVKPSVTKQMLYKYREFFDKNSSGINDPAYKEIVEEATTELSMKRSDTTWADIGGLDHIKKQFDRALILPKLKPELFKSLKLTASRGFLLYGPPGTGKTMIVKALSNQLKIPFLTFNSSELISKWVGESAKQVQAMFDRANAMDEGCILFIDEIDSVLSKRYDDSGYGSRHDTQVVSTFLTNLDGVEKSDNKVVLIGATNNPSNLDPAAIRPGRLSTLIYVGLPDLKQRESILRTILGKLDNVSLTHDEYKELARKTKGFSGADLDALVSRAKSNLLDKVDLEGDVDDSVEQIDFDSLKGILDRKDVQASNLPKDMHRYKEFCREHGGGELCDPVEEGHAGVDKKKGDRLGEADALEELADLGFPEDD